MVFMICIMNCCIQQLITSEEENTTGNTISRMELSNKDDFSRSGNDDGYHFYSRRSTPNSSDIVEGQPSKIKFRRKGSNFNSPVGQPIFEDDSIKEQDLSVSLPSAQSEAQESWSRFSITSMSWTSDDESMSLVNDCIEDQDLSSSLLSTQSEEQESRSWSSFIKVSSPSSDKARGGKESGSMSLCVVTEI